MRLIEDMILNSGRFNNFLGDETDLGYEGRYLTSLGDALRVYHCLIWQEDHRRYCGYHDYQFLGRLAQRKNENGPMPTNRVRNGLIFLKYFDLIQLSNKRAVCDNGIIVLKWWKPDRGESAEVKIEKMAESLKGNYRRNNDYENYKDCYDIY